MWVCLVTPVKSKEKADQVRRHSWNASTLLPPHSTHCHGCRASETSETAPEVLGLPLWPLYRMMARSSAHLLWVESRRYLCLCWKGVPVHRLSPLLAGNSLSPNSSNAYRGPQLPTHFLCSKHGTGFPSPISRIGFVPCSIPDLSGENIVHLHIIFPIMQGPDYVGAVLALKSKKCRYYCLVAFEIVYHLLPTKR